MTRRKAAAPKAINPPDLDGDSKPGGSLATLAFDTARAAWAACDVWAALRGLEDSAPWPDMTEADRLNWAIEADRCIADPSYVPTFPGDLWESTVRGKVFAAVVGAIAR